MYMMKKPEKANNLDKTVVETTIKCFEDLIRSALEVGGRSRFRTIKLIASQAEMLISMTGDRVGDHHDGVQPLLGNVIGGNDYDGEDNVGMGAIYQNQLPRMGVGPDDMMRQLVDSIGPFMESMLGREKFEAQKNSAIELDFLMVSRDRIAKLTGVLDKDNMLHQMDARIRVVLDKISKEGDDEVVPAKLLRGHQADRQIDGRGPQDLLVLGAPESVREEGAGGSSRHGGEEEMGPTDGT
jgi:hypothetical protein